ncbi:hypothetical protein H6A35_01595 [Collinsella tanakaei]|nr:hypothetical protein [Collinsella tanakaei]
MLDSNGEARTLVSRLLDSTRRSLFRESGHSCRAQRQCSHQTGGNGDMQMLPIHVVTPYQEPLPEELQQHNSDAQCAKRRLRGL